MVTKVSTVTVYAGDTLRLEYHLLDDQGDPADVSAWDFTAQWRQTVTSTDAIDLTVDTTEAATGVIIISATADQTNLMSNPGVWDLQGIDGDEVHTFLRGVTRWMKDVTRV